ncbi:hypothetical protein [Algiphilus aromaticivorans]|uniref:hypothetical protein n=1 Tax=Algiphilus aromaticivorans TaxID=382454 RepID=UPI0005C22E35|nr:hypothetical protein [Algiphilus aromaticivorans]
MPRFILRRATPLRALKLFAFATTLTACGGSSVPTNAPGNGDSGPPPERESIDEQIADAIGNAEQRGCDFLDPAYCQFPWPSNALTVEDPETPTGRRLNLQLAGMPMNIVGLPMNPSEWNVDDGFSPGQMMLTHVPDLDLEASGAAPVTDIEASLQTDAPILAIDAETGERHPIWIEIDSSETAATPVCDAAPGVNELFALIGDAPEGLGAVLETLSDGCATALAPIFEVLGEVLDSSGLLPNNTFKVDPPALILRPGRNFQEGHRYIVAMRDLRDAEGEPLDAPATFRVFRDNHVSELEAVNARRENMEGIFAKLADHGVDRESLYLAWDFTVRSSENLATPVLRMRDEALDSLGGGAPDFEIVEVQDFGDGNDSIRRVEGRMTVPNYLNAPDGLCDNTPVLSELADYCAGIEDTVAALQGTEAPVISDAANGIADGLELLLRDLGQIPLSRLNYGTPRGEAPEQNPLQPTQEFRFQCEIPRTAIGSFEDAATWVRPAVPTLYGHGLLGGKGEVGGSSTERLRELNLMHCAIDWIGMSTRDVPSTLLILLEMGQFASMTDRMQQGIINWHFMARLLKHPDGLASNPAFQSADGRPVFSNERVVYDGNSQGGILGGPVIATSPDVTRASLGVPGMNYSTLLRRSVDFDPYGTFFYAAYPNSFDQSFILSLVNNLWDRGENNGYINDLRRPDAYNAIAQPIPDHEVLMHVAFGDHQVADVSAEVMNRSLGGAIHRPGVEEGRHSNVNPYWGMPTAVDGESGSAMVIWDIGPLGNDFNEGTATSPTTNTPPHQGQDPHSDPRKEVASAIQRYDFLLDDRFTNVCGGRPCFARDYVSAGVASGAAGNAQPLVRVPGPATAVAGGSAQLFAIAADPDRDALGYSWEVRSGGDCVSALTESDQPIAAISLDGGCADQSVALTVTVSDGRGGNASADTRVEILAP